MLRSILLLLGLSFSAHALTFAQAETEAAQNSPEIRRLKAEVERTSWGKLDAISGYIPHVAIALDHYLNSKYMREDILFGGQVVNFPAAYPQDNLNLDVEWTVFDGLAALDRFRGARRANEAAELDLSRAHLTLTANVRNAFYQALAAQKLVEVAKADVKTLEGHLNRAQVTERSGYGVRFDVLRIQATLEEARADQQAAENNVFITRDALTALLGRQGADARPLEGELPVLTEKDVPADLELEPAHRDDVQAQIKRDEAAGLAASAARGFWFPSLSLFANEQYYKFGTFDPLIESNSSFQNAWAVGLRLKWNLFDGGHSIAVAGEASAAAAAASAQTARDLAELPREFDTWKRKYFYNVALYKARLRALQEFEESVRLAGVGLRAGTRTHTETLDAELDLFRARAGLVRAQADAVEALGHLELAVGRPLWTRAAP